jgi:hypothetical protein
MFVFGEVSDAIQETTMLVEDIVRSQVIEIVRLPFPMLTLAICNKLCRRRLIIWTKQKWHASDAPLIFFFISNTTRYAWQLSRRGNGRLDL